MDRISANAGLLFTNGRYADLDAIISRYAKLDDVMMDGKFKLAAIDRFIDQQITLLPKEVL
ncbi:MAG: hypothetical protein U1F35_01750 [Steroidobacteraceae bacterium]